MAETFECRRCSGPLKMEKAPFRNELGEKILAAVCQDCWKDWLEHQTMLINHYGLDPREKKSRDFLYEQVEHVLLGKGDGAGIDTTQEGSIEW